MSLGKSLSYFLPQKVFCICHNKYRYSLIVFTTQNWWSKMSSRFRNLNIGRTLRVPSSSKLRLLGSAKSMENLLNSENAAHQKSAVARSLATG